MGFFRDIKASRAPLLAFISIGMVWAAFSAQVPVLKAQIGASDVQFGAVFLIASVGAFAAMWLAPLTDRIFGTFSLQIGVCALALPCLLLGFSGGVTFFTFALFLVSGGSGVTDVLMNARVSEAENATGRALMNLNHALFSFSYAATAMLTGLAREAGFGPVAVFTALAGVILLLSFFMRVPHLDVENVPTSTGPPSVRSIVWIGGLVVMAGFFTEQAVEGWSALHLERTLGGGAAEGALGPAVLGLTMAFGRLFGHGVAALVDDIAMIAGACLLAAAGLALAAVAPTLFLAYLGFGIVGVGISVVAPLALALVGRHVPSSERVKALSHASVIGYGAFFVGPSIIGLVSEFYGLRVAFLIVAGLLAVVAAAIVPLLARSIARAQ